MSRVTRVRKKINALLQGVVALGVAALMVNCAGTKPGTGYSSDTPDEIQKLVEKKYSQSVYSVGTATASDEGTATRKATLQARAEIARQFKSQIDVLQKSYEESINESAATEYTQAAEIFASLEVSDSRIAKSLVRQEKDGSYSAKVLVIVTADQLKTLLDEKMQSYTSFKASNAYKQLEDRVAKERELGGAATE